MSGEVVAGLVAAFILGIVVSAAILKRFARHFPANENIGKTVLQMTRHSGFNDFMALAFGVGFALCALLGGVLWYSFPRTVTITEQVPVDRIVTKEVPVIKEVVREIPVPASQTATNNANATADTPNSQACPKGLVFNFQTDTCVCRNPNMTWDPNVNMCSTRNAPTQSSTLKDPSGKCPDDYFCDFIQAACVKNFVCDLGRHFDPRGPGCVIN